MVPHFVRPFEDPFVHPNKKPSPPSLFPPHQPLVEQQLPVYPSVTSLRPADKPPLDCSVNHSSINSNVKPPRLKQPVSDDKSIPVPKALDLLNPVPAVAKDPLPPPDSVKILSCHRLSSTLKSRLDSPVAADQLEDLSPRLVLTKGPPDKLDASPHKLRFLATFGLTTLTTRNEIELNKLERCRSLPSMVVVEDGGKPPPLSVLSLPHPQRSPRSLPLCDTKLSFMATLKLNPLSGKERKERENIWQEVLAERRRRKCITPLVQYCCQQRVNSPENSPVRWTGVEGVLQAYQAYHTECSLEASVLRAECDRLQMELSVRKDEASTLERRLDALHNERDKLECARREMQQSIEALKLIVHTARTLNRPVAT